MPGDQKRVRVDLVKVGKRHRVDLGDIDGLAASIATVGMLQPIGVTRKNDLVWGQRRLVAARKLGWKTIPARVVDVDRLLAERDENEARKSFTASERVAIAKAIEDRTPERRGRPGKEKPQEVAEISRGAETRGHVAESAGFGNHETYRQAKLVVETARPELVRAMDREELSINAAARLSKLSFEEQSAIVHAVSTGEAKDFAAAERLVKRERHVRRLRENVGIPEGQFRVILADPPWAYDNSGFEQSAADHYETFPADVIAAKWRDEVRAASTDESVLALWVTSPLLPAGLHVMTEWGFEYVASFVWAKDKAPGIGWWANTKHEILLLGRKASSPHPAIKPDTVIAATVGTHSNKPEAFYELIEAMYPVDVERPVHLELFSRVERPGWRRGLYNQEVAA